MPAATIIAAIIGAAATVATTAATLAAQSMQSNDDRGCIISNALSSDIPLACAFQPVHGAWVNSPAGVAKNYSPDTLLGAWLASGDSSAQSVKDAGHTTVAQLTPSEALLLQNWWMGQAITQYGNSGDSNTPPWLTKVMVHAEGLGVKAAMVIRMPDTQEPGVSGPHGLVQQFVILVVHHAPKAGTTRAAALVFTWTPNDWPYLGPAAWDPADADFWVDHIESSYPQYVSTGGSCEVTGVGFVVKFAAAVVTKFQIEPPQSALAAAAAKSVLPSVDGKALMQAYHAFVASRSAAPAPAAHPGAAGPAPTKGK